MVVASGLIGDQTKNVADHIEPSAFLVVRIQTIPGRLFDVGMGKHFILGPGRLHPAAAGFQVHGAQLPALGGVLEPALKTPLLFLIADGRPVLHQKDGELSAGQIIGRLGVEQANASQHFAVLRSKQVVANRKEGNQVFYSLRDPVLVEVLDILKRYFYILKRYFYSQLSQTMSMLKEIRCQRAAQRGEGQPGQTY